MKTQTMLLLGAAAIGGYYLYTKSESSAAKTVAVLGGGADGTQSVNVSVDGNMSAADVTAMQTAWNAAMTANDLTQANTVIANLKTANHPVAAASLQTIVTNAQTAAASTAGYSAGAMSLRRIQQLPSLGRLPYHGAHLDHVHRLAMIGRI